MTFLQDYSRFLGTGAKNAAGQDLETFLERYDAKRYDCPSNTTDIIILRSQGPLTRADQPLKVLLVQRGNHPCIGFWATPGGFVEMREDLRRGAERELEEETGVSGLPLQQLRTWGNYDRDPRWRVITTAFLGLVEGELPVKAADDAADARWFDVSLEERPLPEDLCLPEGRQGKAYRLTLSDESSALTLRATVLLTCSKHPLLPQEEYTLLENDSIAADHACLICEAVLYLQKKLK